jgi:MFS family permease
VKERDDRPHSRFPVAVLRHRDYRLLWIGQFISTLGTQMHAVALSWQVWELTGNPVYLGLLGLVRAVALMGMSLIGGQQADARNRRTLLLVTQSSLVLFSGSLAIATFMGVVNVTMLFVVAALVAATGAFDAPARQALIPNLVPRDQLASAMSLNILAMSVARMAGPAIGGVAVALIGVAGTYTLDAASFLWTIIALQMMRTPMAAPAVRTAGFAAIVEGLRFIRTTPIIWGIMLMDFLANLLGSSMGLAPVFAESVLNAGPQGLGLLLSAPAAGAVFGGVVISLVPSVQRPGRVVVASVMAYGLCLSLFGLAPTLLLALAALFGAGAVDSVSVAMRHTVRNLATPDELRGRVAASHSALAMGGPRLGEFQSGITASFIGPRGAMVAGGVGVMVVAAAVAWLVPAVMRYRFDDPDDPASETGVEATPEAALAESRSAAPGRGR